MQGYIVGSGSYTTTQGALLIVTEDQQRAITPTTLYRDLDAICRRYPKADVVETLARIAFEFKLSRTAEILDSAVDMALIEDSEK